MVQILMYRVRYHPSDHGSVAVVERTKASDITLPVAKARRGRPLYGAALIATTNPVRNPERPVPIESGKAMGTLPVAQLSSQAQLRGLDNDEHTGRPRRRFPAFDLR